MFRDRPRHPVCLRIYRAAFTILAAGPGQVLFFIDSFERRAVPRFARTTALRLFRADFQAFLPLL